MSYLVTISKNFYFLLFLSDDVINLNLGKSSTGKYFGMASKDFLKH